MVHVRVTAAERTLLEHLRDVRDFTKPEQLSPQMRKAVTFAETIEKSIAFRNYGESYKQYLPVSAAQLFKEARRVDDFYEADWYEIDEWWREW